MHNSTFKQSLFIASIIYLYALYLGFTPIDDGIRHLIYNSLHRSWGELYPYTFFKDFSFDPWGLWDSMLHFLTGDVVIGETAQANLDRAVFIVNFTALSFIGIWSLLMMKTEKGFPTYTYVVFPILIAMFSYRYINVRPDLLSGLYIMAIVLLSTQKRHPAYLLLAGAIYSPMYYVSWFYVGNLFVMFLILQQFRYAIYTLLGGAIGVLYFLSVGGNDYIELTQYILKFSSMREEMKIFVEENTSVIGLLNVLRYTLGASIVTLTLMSGSLYLLFKNRNYLRTTPIMAVMIMFLPYFLAQSRFFYLLLPLYIVGAIIFLNRAFKWYYFDDKNSYMIIFTAIALAYYSVYTISEYKQIIKETKDDADYFKTFIKKHEPYIINSSLSNISYIPIYTIKGAKNFPSFSIESYTKDISAKGLYSRFLRHKLNKKEQCDFVSGLGGDYYIVKEVSLTKKEKDIATTMGIHDLKEANTNTTYELGESIETQNALCKVIAQKDNHTMLEVTEK